MSDVTQDFRVSGMAVRVFSVGGDPFLDRRPLFPAIVVIGPNQDWCTYTHWPSGPGVMGGFLAAFWRFCLFNANLHINSEADGHIDLLKFRPCAEDSL